MLTSCDQQASSLDNLISQTLSAHAAAHSSRDIDEAMKYWLRLEKPEVFMAQHGWEL